MISIWAVLAAGEPTFSSWDAVVCVVASILIAMIILAEIHSAKDEILREIRKLKKNGESK